MVIAIAGGSCSGKTTIANILAGKIDANVIALDQYFKDPNTFPVVHGCPDYDRIEAIDWDKAINDIRLAKTQGDIIAEGFLALAKPELRQLYDFACFIDADDQAMIERRLKREPDTPSAYIINVVAERYRTLVQPTKQYADLVLDGGLPSNVVVDKLIKALPNS
jgi:uridine kinase